MTDPKHAMNEQQTRAYVARCRIAHATRELRLAQAEALQLARLRRIVAAARCNDLRTLAQEL
jgi:hypothetical protein